MGDPSADPEAPVDTDTSAVPEATTEAVGIGDEEGEELAEPDGVRVRVAAGEALVVGEVDRVGVEVADRHRVVLGDAEGEEDRDAREAVPEGVDNPVSVGFPEPEALRVVDTE